jgi:hypothetical protein
MKVRIITANGIKEKEPYIFDMDFFNQFMSMNPITVSTSGLYTDDGWTGTNVNYKDYQTTADGITYTTYGSGTAPTFAQIYLPTS